jgi:hypothetical protein
MIIAVVAVVAVVAFVNQKVPSFTGTQSYATLPLPRKHYTSTDDRPKQGENYGDNDNDEDEDEDEKAWILLALNTRLALLPTFPLEPTRPQLSANQLLTCNISHPYSPLPLTFHCPSTALPLPFHRAASPLLASPCLFASPSFPPSHVLEQSSRSLRCGYRCFLAQSYKSNDQYYQIPSRLTLLSKQEMQVLCSLCPMNHHHHHHHYHYHYQLPPPLLLLPTSYKRPASAE